MALSHNVLQRTVWGDRDVAVDEITFDNTYPAGGEAIAASDVGFVSIDLIIPGPAAADAGAVANVVKWDRTNGKLQLFEGGGAATDLAEQNTADQSAKKCICVIVGKRKV